MMVMIMDQYSDQEIIYVFPSGSMNKNNSYENSPHSFVTKGKKYALNGEQNFKY